MARLTPLNYNQQVVNPMQMALEGYQAGFGQMQQLDEVRRQREADEMNRQQFAQQTEMNQLQMDEYRRKTAQAERSQAVLGEFVARFDSENPPSAQEIQMFMLENPEYAEQLSSVYGAMSEDEQAQSIQSNATMYSFARSKDKEGLRNYLGRTLEAAKNSGDANTAQAITADLKLLDAPGGLSNIAAMSAVALSATEGGRSALNTLTPEAEERTALMKNIDARLEAEAAAGNIGPRGSDTWNQRAAELFEQEAQASATRGQNQFYINTSPLEGGEGDETKQLLDIDENGRATVLAGNRLSMFAIPGSEVFGEMFQAAEGQFTTTNQTSQMAAALGVIRDAGFIPEAGADKPWFDSAMAYAASANDSRVGKFISGISGSPAAEAYQDIDALKSSLFTNMVTNSEIPSKALDTEKEAQRFLAQFGGKEYLSTITALANYDMVYGSGLFLQESLYSGAIDVETYNNVRGKVDNFAMQNIAYADNSSQREREELNTALGNAYEGNQFRNQQFGKAYALEGNVFVEVMDEQSGQYRLLPLRGGS
jgi:hypothetical protein